MRTGFISGLLATAPMTAAMWMMRRKLPWWQRYPLHPRLVTEGVMRKLGIAPHLTKREREHATTLSHFGYGALTGSAYPTVARRLPLPPIASGMLYGAGVWAASYAGWLPATGIMPSPRRHARQRLLLIFAAHLVWGATLGLLSHRQSRTLNADGNQLSLFPEPQ